MLETFGKKLMRTREVARLTVELAVAIEQWCQGVEVLERGLLNLKRHTAGSLSRLG
jgi:hypothetical protein